MQRIFHYTNYESLALILKNRTIRFSRLDGVDDIKEAQTHAGVPFGKYTFVSCWTEDNIESIPQWHMYAQGMQGVRIEFSRLPFRSLDFVVPKGLPGVEIFGQMTAPVTFEESLGQTYFVVPNYFDNNFAAPVEYVTDVDAEFRQLVLEAQDPAGGRGVIAKNFTRMARLKSTQWQFQREFRFALLIIPRDPTDPFITGSPMLSGQDPGISYFDVPIDPLAFNGLVIRTGPLCSSGARACVEAIVSKWAPEARIEVSAFDGNIRQR